MQYIIQTDGGARGNPGPAAVGVVIEREEESKVKSRKSKVLVAEFGKRIGETTNNVAEYSAVREALAYLRNYPINKLSNNPIIQFYLDSNLVVQQLNGNFKIKDANLQKLAFDVRILEKEVGSGPTRINPEENTRADYL